MTEIHKDFEYLIEKKHFEAGMELEVADDLVDIAINFIQYFCLHVDDKQRYKQYTERFKKVTIEKINKKLKANK